MPSGDELVETTKQIVARHDSDSELRMRSTVVPHRLDGSGAGDRIHSARVRNDLYSALDDCGQNALHRTHEIPRITQRRIALFLLLKNGHGDFREIVEHQIVDRSLLDLTARSIEIVAPESLASRDANHCLQLLSSDRCGGSTKGPRCGPGLCSAARNARLSISRVFSG